MLKLSSISLVLCSILLAGCVSAPKVSDPSGVDISVVRLTSDQALMSFGAAPTDANPYRTPGGMMMGYPHELIVLRFTVVAAKKAQISIDGITATGSDGSDVAKYYYIDDYTNYVTSWQGDLAVKKAQVVQDTYLPGDHFQAWLGHHTYYAVLVGKNPIPRPYQAKVSISVDDGTPRIFTFDVAGK
jgi:hypothetical protein